MLEFDADTTKFLEIVYHGSDFSRRRRASYDALSPGPGETVIDIGCGNGLLTVELARAVGSEGKVIGIDPSSDMRRAAEDRCGGLDWAGIVGGTADALPLPDASSDKAVSVQVFEYLDDLGAACGEAFRVLRSGGILAVGDMHFDTLAWFSDAPDRMARMVRSWDQHVVERAVPAVLPEHLQAAGFTIEDISPVTFSDHQLRPDGLASMMLRLMRRYAIDNGHLSESDAQEWYAEQQQLAADGRFFFSLTHFVILARKP